MPKTANVYYSLAGISSIHDYRLCQLEFRLKFTDRIVLQWSEDLGIDAVEISIGDTDNDGNNNELKMLFMLVDLSGSFFSVSALQ